MKFAEHLSAHITPEWRKQYINYEVMNFCFFIFFFIVYNNIYLYLFIYFFYKEMKAMLYMAVEEAPSVDSVEDEVLKRHFANFDENFFHYCDKELKKINTFYSEKLAEATRKFATLNAELKTCVDESERSAKKSKSLKKSSLPHRKAQELKLAFSEFYLSLILLQNYQNLNHTGFRKILKKHDKVKYIFLILLNKFILSSLILRSSFCGLTLVLSGVRITWNLRTFLLTKISIT